jgi:hypothetical protein
METRILNKMLATKKTNMKKYISLFTISALLLAGCIKNDPVLYTDSVAEIDATALNANAAGLTYPILPRVLRDGRASATTDSTLRRNPQTVKIRVNLVGPQSTKDETVGYETFSSPVTTFNFPATATGQTPSAPAAALTITNAVVGTNYAALPGTVTIPANSSFGYIDLVILPTASTPATGRFVGIRLTSTGSIKPSENYKELGLIIDQR